MKSNDFLLLSFYNQRNYTYHPHNMSAQAAGKAIAAGAKAAGKAADGHVLNKGAKRDPELYVGPNPTTMLPRMSEQTRTMAIPFPFEPSTGLDY